MKILFIFSGLLRSFVNNCMILQNYMHESNIDYQIMIHCTNEDGDRFKIQDEIKLRAINNVRIIVYENITSVKFPTINNKYDIGTIKINNTLKQWYKLYQIFSLIDPHEFDFIVRMRPDIELRNKTNFLSIFKNLEQDTLYIPNCNNIFDDRIFETIGKFDSINDQFCISDYKTMRTYVDIYKSVTSYENLPFIPEVLLHKYITDKGLKIKRISVDYTLVLSKCNLIAISGDSGSGKSTIMDIIRPVFKFDKLLCFETDRYHKWKRGDANWERYTHLHPDANWLDKMCDDTADLKYGKNIFAVDYDHETGNFTSPKVIESNDFIVMCGLHTLYSKQIQNIIDIKIYVDTQDEIKKMWKIKRDVEIRGHTLEKVLQSIKKRDPDFKQYIESQKRNADIVVKYSFAEDYSVKTNILTTHAFFNKYKHCLENKINVTNTDTNYYRCEINDENISMYNLDKSRLAILQFIIILIIYHEREY